MVVEDELNDEEPGEGSEEVEEPLPGSVDPRGSSLAAVRMDDGDACQYRWTEDFGCSSCQ